MDKEKLFPTPSAPLSSKEPQDAPIIITVHGTFASEGKDEGERWWQRSSQFTTNLMQRLANKGFSQIEIHPFHWSGMNSDNSRLEAAGDLAHTVRKLGNSGRPVALIAHSHGGNVVMESLAQHRASKPLSAILTLGTPFFSRRLKPIPTLIAAFKVLLGLAVTPAMAMYSWSAFQSINESARYELLVLALGGLALVLWSLYTGSKTLLRQRRAKGSTRKAVAPDDWLVIHSPRDEAMRLLEAAVSVRPTYVTVASARRQLDRLAVLTGVIGTITFLYFTASYFAEPIIKKIQSQQFTGGLLADFTFLLVLPIVFLLIYGAIWTAARIGGGRILSSLLTSLIHGGIVGAAYGGDDAYALTKVTRLPPYLPEVREQRIAAADLGGINENAIIESARELYAGLVSDEASDMAFGDPDLLWKRLSDALYHNAYMRDDGVVEAVAEHLAKRFTQ